MVVCGFKGAGQTRLAWRKHDMRALPPTHVPKPGGIARGRGSSWKRQMHVEWYGMSKSCRGMGMDRQSVYASVCHGVALQWSGRKMHLGIKTPRTLEVTKHPNLYLYEEKKTQPDGFMKSKNVWQPSHDVSLRILQLLCFASSLSHLPPSPLCFTEGSLVKSRGEMVLAQAVHQSCLNILCQTSFSLLQQFINEPLNFLFDFLCCTEQPQAVTLWCLYSQPCAGSWSRKELFFCLVFGSLHAVCELFMVGNNVALSCWYGNVVLKRYTKKRSTYMSVVVSKIAVMWYLASSRVQKLYL